MHNLSGILHDEQIDQTIRHRIATPNNSGYLDEEYEITKDFPTLQQYHFRIEDDEQIRELERLRRQSKPVEIQNIYGHTNSQFKSKMDNLLSSLDSFKVSFTNSYPQETHGFYTLADSYDDESAIQKVLQSANIAALSQKIEAISLRERQQPCFIRRRSKKMQVEQSEEMKELTKKIKKINISMNDL